MLKKDFGRYAKGQFMTHHGGAAVPCDGLSPAAANAADTGASSWPVSAAQLDQALAQVDELHKLVKAAKAAEKSKAFWAKIERDAYL